MIWKLAYINPFWHATLLYYILTIIVNSGKDDFVGKVRKDRRCGPEFPLPGNGGLPSECDPNSEKNCCSKVILIGTRA